MTTQTEAQRLALALSSTRRWHELTDDDCDKAAAELRRLEEVSTYFQDSYGQELKTSNDLRKANAELLESLKYISEGFRILKDSDFPALAKAREAIAKHGGSA